MGRPKLNRTALQARVERNTPDKLKQMALELGFQWGDSGNTGALLDAIAQMPIDKIRNLIGKRSKPTQ